MPTPHPCTKMSISPAILLIFLLLLSPAGASEDVILIASPGCTKCAAAERTVEGVLPDYPGAEIVVYNVYSEEGREVIREHRLKGGVPSIVIGNSSIAYRDYDGDQDLLEGLVREALRTEIEEVSGVAGSVISVLGPSPDDGSGRGSFGAENEALEDIDVSSLSMMTVFLAGFLAGFNPCLLGVLAFLAAAVISSSGRRRDLVMMVVFFSLGIFCMYYLFGVGMLKTLHAGTIASSFRIALTILLVALGLVHLEDARRLSAGGRSLFKASWSQKYIEGALSKGKFSSYFILGALFSLVKAPCVGAVYIAILGLISEEGYSTGAVYLLLYNLGVIFPILILGCVIALGMSPEKVDGFRKEHRAGIRLATGLTLLALAPLIYWQVI
ncbi:cytochrome c biogenesis CcdA family protein [Methanocrinis sp.]|uniref:cytochrome c biogenesis CcdA family protein n=1 Tax=Methanocrinis sp. TaxID=3101522 RepID=UPI003D0989B5